jgi:hypothetical protein
MGELLGHSALALVRRWQSLVLAGLAIATGCGACSRWLGEEVATAGTANVESLVVQGDSLFWLDRNTLRTSGGDGSNARTLVSIEGGPHYFRCVAAAERMHCFRVDGSSELSLVTISLHPPYKSLARPIGLQGGHVLAADDQWIYWPGITHDLVSRLVLYRTRVDSDATEVLWDDVPRIFDLFDAGPVLYVAANGIHRVHKDTGKVDELLTEPSGVWDVAVDATNLYWTQGGVNPESGRVLRRPLTGGDTVVIADKLDNPGAVFVDATHVYWTATTLGRARVWRVPRAGGANRELQELPGVAAFLVTHDYLYWFAPGSDHDTLRRKSLVSEK